MLPAAAKPSAGAAAVYDTNLMPGTPSKIQEPLCARIPAGEFLMGCEAGRDDERPVHLVSVRGFELAAVQVTNRDFAAFIEATGHPAPPEWSNPDFNDLDQPVVSVSWIEAVKYCNWLSRATGRRYRLPTEAEWEWSAMGGIAQALYPWGNANPADWPPYVRRWGGSVNGPLAVGQEKPNAYGLFDVSESVHEWCGDWYQKDYYAVSPKDNPQGPSEGDRRASRGGSWRHQIKVSRCAARSSIPPYFQYSDYGFRVARDLEGEHRSLADP